MSPQDQNPAVGAAMVVGGGIGGMQAALDLADAGIKVYLVETTSAIGGRMAQLDKTFPTNDCAMCTMAPRLVEIGRHRDIEILTLSDVERVEGQAKGPRRSAPKMLSPLSLPRACFGNWLRQFTPTIPGSPALRRRRAPGA